MLSDPTVVLEIAAVVVTLVVAALGYILYKLCKDF